MATLNLGRIKPVFRGAYSGSTAYVVDDIVTHGNESFICIQAHGAGTQATSVTAYWTKLAAKGTDGTDVGTTITTQGDILYRDGSGLQRLAKGTAAQALVMNSGATAPEWGSGGKAVEIFTMADETVGNIASDGDFIDWDFTPTISGKIFLSHVGSHRAASASHFYCTYRFNNGSGEVIQHTGGMAYPPSSHSHNQGWSASFVPTTNDNADSTTPMLVTASTQCTFRISNDSGGIANAGNDGGKDHIVSAIIFET